MSLQFIEVVDNKVYRLTNEARKLLQDVGNLEVTLYVIVGDYRTGKSTLMNEILSQSELFPTSPNVQAMTHGLVMNAKPIYRKRSSSSSEMDSSSSMLLLEEEKKCVKFVVDSEGLGAPGATLQHDMNIFIFSVLIAGKLLFNTMGAITSKSLDALQYAGRMAAKIRENQQLTCALPELLWIMRDFALKMQDDTGSSLTASEYVDYVLTKIQPSLCDDLKQLFPVRRALTLPDLKSANFASGVQALKTDLFANSKSSCRKMLGKTPMTGFTLIAMADSICEAMTRSDEFPNLDTLFNTMATCSEIQAGTIIRSLVTQMVQKKCNFYQPILMQIGTELPSLIMNKLNKILLSTPTPDVIQKTFCMAFELVKQLEEVSLAQWKTFLQDGLQSILLSEQETNEKNKEEQKQLEENNNDNNTSRNKQKEEETNDSDENNDHSLDTFLKETALRVDSRTGDLIQVLQQHDFQANKKYKKQFQDLQVSYKQLENEMETLQKKYQSACESQQVCEEAIKIQEEKCKDLLTQVLRMTKEKQMNKQTSGDELDTIQQDYQNTLSRLKQTYQQNQVQQSQQLANCEFKLANCEQKYQSLEEEAKQLKQQSQELIKELQKTQATHRKRCLDYDTQIASLKQQHADQEVEKAAYLKKQKMSELRFNMIQKEVDIYRSMIDNPTQNGAEQKEHNLEVGKKE